MFGGPQLYLGPWKWRARLRLTCLAPHPLLACSKPVVVQGLGPASPRQIPQHLPEGRWEFVHGWEGWQLEMPSPRKPLAMSDGHALVAVDFPPVLWHKLSLPLGSISLPDTPLDSTGHGSYPCPAHLDRGNKPVDLPPGVRHAHLCHTGPCDCQLLPAGVPVPLQKPLAAEFGVPRPGSRVLPLVGSVTRPSRKSMGSLGSWPRLLPDGGCYSGLD